MSLAKPNHPRSETSAIKFLSVSVALLLLLFLSAVLVGKALGQTSPQDKEADFIIYLPMVINHADAGIATPTATATPSPSTTPTSTATPSPSTTPTETATSSATATASDTPTETPSPTPSETETTTPSPTLTALPTPYPGPWSGLTSRNRPVSFDVSQDSSQWSTFTLTTNYSASSCGVSSATIEITLPGPGAIANNAFSGSGNGFSFSGDFTSASESAGTYSFNRYLIVISLPSPPYVCYYYLTQSGSWTATWQPGSLATATPTISPTLDQSGTPTPTQTATLTALFTPTPTRTATRSPTLTATPSPSTTPTATSSPTPSETATATPSPTSTLTALPTPNPGAWSGLTSRSYPVGFTVSPDSSQWSSFSITTNYSAPSCGVSSGTIKITLPGPGAIANNQFSGSGNGFNFNGEFTSTSNSEGEYAFDNYQIVISLPYPPYVCLYYLTQSGSWTAAWQDSSTATPTSTPTHTLTPPFTPTQTSTSSPTLTPTASASETMTPTPTQSDTPTPTESGTTTPTPTQSNTPTPTETETTTPTPTETATPTPTATRPWIIENADNEALFAGLTDRALRLDSQGRPHIAYGSDALHHAWLDGAKWYSETVDAPLDSLVGTWASLALDAQDHPYIAYYDSHNADLKVAIYDGATWQIQRLDSAGDVGRYTSIVIDPASGWPRIAYYDNTNERLKYASWNGSTWQIEAITDPGGGGISASLALDSANRPHISFMGQGHLRYARQQGSAWSISNVDGIFGASATSIAIGAYDRPRIGYITDDRLWLNYAAFDGTTWYTTTIDTSGDIIFSVSLALDQQGRPHMAYHRHAGIASHAWFDGNTWQLESIDNAAYSGYSLSLACDSTGGLHAAYLNDARRRLRYGFKDSAWNLTTVHQGGVAGNNPSIAIDSNGLPHIVHSVSLANISSETKLVYTHYTGGEWKSETVVASALFVNYPSLALSKDDLPRIAYHDAGQVFYAAWDGASWSVETVEPEAGWQSSTVPSLALDSQDRPHISYYYLPGEDLRYAWRDESGWHRLSIDTPGTMGSRSSIKLDGSDRAHIAYYDATNNIMKYAWYDGAVWQIQVVDSQIGAGSTLSLALDGQDRPRIAYQVNDDTFRYAWFDGSSWHYEDLFPAANSGVTGGISLALTASGEARVAFVHWSTYYAERSASGVWQIRLVNHPGQNSYNVSLALDSAGEPQIACADSSGNLFHAALVPHPSKLR